MKQLFFFGFLFIISCTQERDFDIPKNLGTEENEMLNDLLEQLHSGELTKVSFAQVRQLYNGRQATQIDGKLAISGVVVSSDESGNFYKEIYIQDHPTNPTEGIKVMIDRRELHNKYNIGREVYLNISGLFVGEANRGDGVIAIGGGEDNDELVAMSEQQSIERVLRTKNSFEIGKKTIALTELTETHIGLFVTLKSVHFLSEEHGQPLVAAKDWYDTQREITQCVESTKTSFLLETSRFADFSEMPIPNGAVRVRGIITKTYNGSDLVLALNAYEDITPDDPSCSE